MLCVRGLSRVSRRQIAEHTGLSRARVCEVVDGLIAEGELIETGSVSVGRGRPTALLEVNPNSVSAGGVWLAEDSIEVGVAGADGEILARQSLPYSGDPVKDIDAIADALKACGEESARSVESLSGLGVVVAGLMNRSLGVICYTTHDTGFEGVPIVKLLEEKTGIEVYADTDIRAAALTDHWNRSYGERALYLSFCDGVGAAFVSERELFGKAHGEAPGLGHITIDRNGPVCECGKQGCLQVYTSNNTFVRDVWPDVDAQQLSSRQRLEMVKKGVDLAAHGHYGAAASMSRIADYIGLGISIAVNMLDPQTVYVGGTLIDYASDAMMDTIRREAMQRITHVFRGVEIKPLMRLQEFELKGAVGLVLLSRFTSLSQARFMLPYSPKTEIGQLSASK